MGKTKIEWTDATWNPVTGCDPISSGCAHCYAARMAKRLAGRGGYPERPHQFDVTLHPERLFDPLGWKKPRMVFVCSMGDLFHDDVAYDLIVHIFAVMALASQHTFQVLTKRAQKMHAVLTLQSFRYDVSAMALTLALRNGYDLGANFDAHRNVIFPLNNVIGMVTAEDQQNADERIGWLLMSPFVLRGVSIEPMLGPIDLRHIQHQGEVEIDALTGDHGVYRPLAGRSEYKLDWVIVGGETGPGARPMQVDWVRSLRDQCVETDTPFFFKSWGSWVDGLNVPDEHLDVALDCAGTSRDYRYMTEWGEIQAFRVGKKAAGRVLDGQAWNQFPEL